MIIPVLAPRQHVSVFAASIIAERIPEPQLDCSSLSRAMSSSTVPKKKMKKKMLKIKEEEENEAEEEE